MSHKHVETSREIRLWIGQIIVPAIGITAMVMSNPEARYYAKTKIDDIKWKLKNKFKKD